MERTVRDTWYEASAARQAAGQVPDDEQAQDCMKKTVRALAILSDQMLKGFPDSEITTTAFMTLTLAREALYNAQPRGMTWWLS